jgi:hypothetical protein
MRARDHKHDQRHKKVGRSQAARPEGAQARIACFQKVKLPRSGW